MLTSQNAMTALDEQIKVVRGRMRNSATPRELLDNFRTITSQLLNVELELSDEVAVRTMEQIKEKGMLDELNRTAKAVLCEESSIDLRRLRNLFAS